ncbi:hypothetical protein PSM7751_01145 [Pseudooceanicola marinus]|uniref:Uncharacterized protein n=1 Tax=Pseudooceanicola marinus TaxID=396013 RepID=A0A1X6YQW2_9RHOB|nr:hypothetical protein PSM7751_01145 [Pseudooceanicola marinus]
MTKQLRCLVTIDLWRPAVKPQLSPAVPICRAVALETPSQAATGRDSPINVAPQKGTAGCVSSISPLPIGAELAREVLAAKTSSRDFGTRGPVPLLPFGAHPQNCHCWFYVTRRHRGGTATSLREYGEGQTPHCIRSESEPQSFSLKILKEISLLEKFQLDFCKSRSEASMSPVPGFYFCNGAIDINVGSGLSEGLRQHPITQSGSWCDKVRMPQGRGVPRLPASPHTTSVASERCFDERAKNSLSVSLPQDRNGLLELSSGRFPDASENSFGAKGRGRGSRSFRGRVLLRTGRHGCVRCAFCRLEARRRQCFRPSWIFEYRTPLTQYCHFGLRSNILGWGIRPNAPTAHRHIVGTGGASRGERSGISATPFRAFLGATEYPSALWAPLLGAFRLYRVCSWSREGASCAR